MHIGLTHEQADFDAIASLLGAYLLNRNIVPLLPRRCNRNVRDFATLYQAELPFLDMGDLPPDPIDLITLVDTQSLITLKRMGKKTAVYVIDHHKLRQNLPGNWTVFIHELGACATIFVESIQEQQIPLTVIQATLLLLGIYEDTGSLTYTRTTARDVRAAGFLLEHGASLEIANDYLYPPLSHEQRQLYDQLLSNITTMQIHEQTIVVATAHAEDMSDEVSSAAHKLRDLLDPDALILLISTVEGIRMVARSTTNQVDVSEIASYFGGGGHKRAAAALMRFDDAQKKADFDALKWTYNELIEILPRFVQPSITVEQIMSYGPLLLSPDQSAEEAARLMQRYGYEGFPVVKNHHVVGLLTRRAVDRALAHKLNLRVGSLMDAGEITIHPHNTLEDLQNIMTTSGWGQIPVIDPKTGEIIGIVTRTDLIKTMSNGHNHKMLTPNLADKLEKALPPTHLALLKTIADQAVEQEMPIYIVGGFVRDLLLERPSLDFDLVVEGRAIALAQSLAKRFGGKVVSHRRFGTAKWKIAGIKQELSEEFSLEGNWNADNLPDSVDLISARTEFYDRPTALPTVERSSIKLDLHRRDFSINTMALRLDGKYYGQLYDYWGGLSDLQHGFVRVLHSLSFVDDPTRLLRAVRFEQRFDFHIESRTLQLMDEAHELLNQVSGDRIRHELDAIMSEEKFSHMLERLQELHLLEAIHPHLVWTPEIALEVEQVISQKPADIWEVNGCFNNLTLRQALIYLAWMFHLPFEHMQEIAQRLRLPKKLLSSIHEVHILKSRLAEIRQDRPSQWVKIFENTSHVALYTVYCLTNDDLVKQAIHRYLTEWQNIKPYADGTTLRQLNIMPSPVYKTILERLRSAWLDGEVETLEEEQQLLQELIESMPEIEKLE
jgi:tRNA nucleotidyltransferase (CCA-adding enzyme)